MVALMDLSGGPMEKKPEDKKPDLVKAIEDLDKKKGKKASEIEVTIPSIKNFKENELAVTINNFLSKNVDDKAGECLFGENLARTGEFYGMKSHPVIALIISGIMVMVLVLKRIFKRKKENDEGYLIE